LFPPPPGKSEDASHCQPSTNLAGEKSRTLSQGDWQVHTSGVDQSQSKGETNHSRNLNRFVAGQSLTPGFNFWPGRIALRQLNNFPESESLPSLKSFGVD
jgi:hypothetical protein